MVKAVLKDASANFMLFEVSPLDGNSPFPQGALLCFSSDLAVRRAEEMFGERPLSFDTAVAASVAMVSDHDTIQEGLAAHVFGEKSFVPAGVFARVEKANASVSADTERSVILPPDLSPESISWMDAVPA